MVLADYRNPPWLSRGSSESNAYIQLWKGRISKNPWLTINWFLVQGIHKMARVLDAVFKVSNRVCSSSLRPQAFFRCLCLVLQITQSGLIRAEIHAHTTKSSVLYALWESASSQQHCLVVKTSNNNPLNYTYSIHQNLTIIKHRNWNIWIFMLIHFFVSH